MASTAKRAPRKSAKKSPQIAIVEDAVPVTYTNADLVRRREAAVPRGVASAARYMRPMQKMQSCGMWTASVISISWAVSAC